MSDTIKFDAKAEDVPVGHGVQIGGSFAASATASTEEIIGTDTLYYIYNVYNGFRLGYQGEAANAGWSWFKRKHKKEFFVMADKLKDPESALYQEMLALLTRAQIDQEAIQTIRAALESAKRRTSILEILDTILALNYEKYFKPVYNASFRLKF